MSDQPHLVREEATTTSVEGSSDRSSSRHDFSPECPFCIIAGAYGPVSPTAAASSAANQLDPEKVDPPSFVLFSSEHVIAFLDIMPLTRGHVLVAPRNHRVKVGDLSPDESGEVGPWRAKRSEVLYCVLTTKLDRPTPSTSGPVRRRRRHAGHSAPTSRLQHCSKQW